jgi:hypothetical protein
VANNAAIRTTGPPTDHEEQGGMQRCGKQRSAAEKT